jgi:hypothetical protein
MRVASIEFTKNAWREISYRHLTNYGAPDEEDFYNDDYYKWKRTGDKGVRYFREDSYDEDGPTREATVTILETSPLFNLQVIDDVIDEKFERRLFSATDDFVLFMVRFLKIPLLR